MNKIVSFGRRVSETVSPSKVKYLQDTLGKQKSSQVQQVPAKPVVPQVKPKPKKFNYIKSGKPEVGPGEAERYRLMGGNLDERKWK